MEFEEAKCQLAAALRSLAPAGALGFEGLLRDILVEVTNLGFGLAKSGPQDGSDVRSLGLNLFEVALEAKRYEEKTALKVDALEAKLFESSRSENKTDLWILAATRAISATDNEKLTRAGVVLGITVLILDWPPEVGQLPDLAVLCAEAEKALNRHLDGHANIGEIVEAIRSHPGYHVAAHRLQRRLIAPDMGYAAATAAMQRWMLEGLNSDRNAASRLGGQFNNVLTPQRGRIPRPKYEVKLDKWLTAGRPVVLLGDEGLGKTWLFLSWWHARASSRDGLPLTLFVPAKEVGDESLLELVARLLEKRLGGGSIDFWKRRVGQWLKLRSGAPQILLMIDGLNQYWLKRDWVDLLQTAYDDEWNGRISILMSCWPEHWNDLQKLASLVPRPSEITVERFDDMEFEMLLGVHGLSRESFSASMLELMKVPRLSVLAITRQKDMIASGDITPERLAVEDWKHRIDLRGSELALSDAEFQDFIAQLGKQLRSSINDTVLTRRNVLEQLGRDSGKERTDLQSTVAELISGQWLVPTGQVNQFRVNPELVPFALGLALAHQLRLTTEEAVANAIIADHIDPFSGQSLGARILRAAVTVAMLDSAVLSQVRGALLTRWLNEQNFSLLDFEAFWRIIGLDVELVLRVVQERWLGRGAGSISIDEITIKALVNAYQFKDVAPQVEARINSWLGWFWKDPLQGFALGQLDLTAPDSLQRQEIITANFNAWQQFEGRDAFPPINLCGDGNPSWLSHRVFGIISFLPRARFIEAIAAWGLARAVMGMPRHFDELAWTLRLNREDPVEARSEVWSLVNRLVESRHRLALDAACWLLEALADPQAEARLQQLRPPEGSTCRRTLRFSSQPTEDLTDPSINVASNELEAANRTLVAEIDVDFSSSRELLVLARTDPNLLRGIIGEKVLSASNLPPAGLRRFLDQIGGFFTVLNDKERGVLEATLDMVIAETSVELSKEVDWYHVQRLEVRLAGRSGLAQLKLLLNEARDRKLLGRVRTRLLDFNQDDIRSVLGQFDIKGNCESVLSWLTLLVEVADHRSIDGWAEIPALPPVPI